MHDHLTLQRLFEQTGARLSVYDIGRRVARLDPACFQAFEDATEPYPTPMQRKAWIAMVQHGQDAAQEPRIWFLRLALDERGLLVPAQRDELLARLLESVLAPGDAADPLAHLGDNPYAYTPRDDRMALFHALLGVELGLPPSRFYAHALEYFEGRLGWEQWGFVGYQGIADVAARHPTAPLDSALPILPAEPLTALCHCLESCRIGAPLADALRTRLSAELQSARPRTAVLAALVRGLATSGDETRTIEAFAALLQRPVGGEIEVLAAISGRAWETLGQGPLLTLFLDRLAVNTHGQSAFEHCLDDLLSVPSMTDAVRAALRAPSASAALRAAFARMTERG